MEVLFPPLERLFKKKKFKFLYCP